MTRRKGEIEKIIAAGPQSHRPRRGDMSDPVADIMTNAHLAGLVEELQESCMRLRLEMSGFDQQIAVIKELIRHPPPHPDPNAFRQHLAGRIKEFRESIDKLRALLPPDMRGE
jgi:hypothetical protein